MRPAPSPLQLLGWPRRISALTTEVPIPINPEYGSNLDDTNL